MKDEIKIIGIDYSKGRDVSTINSVKQLSDSYTSNKKKCKDCKNCICNSEEYKDGVDCKRLLNKKLSNKEVYLDNNDCKYYEEYIGHPNSCSSCEYLQLEVKHITDGEYRVEYKCTLNDKIIDNILKDSALCKDYININFKEDK